MSGVFSRNALEHAVAGSTGTMLATLLFYPLDRLKTLRQVGDERTPQLFLRILRQEGAPGFYVGSYPMLQTVGASNFLYFLFYEGLRDALCAALRGPLGEVGGYETLLASALAGSLNMLCTEPLWRACTVVQARSLQEHAGGAGREASGGVLQVVLRMRSAEGTAALWRGVGSSLWLVTNPVVQFFAYDLFKGLLAAAEDVTSSEAFVLGAAAKALATVLTFPLQVAQSRLRATEEGQLGAAGGLTPEEQGLVACLRALVQREGLRGLYRGLGTKLLQTVTQAAFMFAFYEKVHWLIRRVSRKGLPLGRRRKRLRR